MAGKLERVIIERPEERRYMGRKAIAAYLGVTTMSVWRWERDVGLVFPQPSIINGRPFYNVEEVDTWMRGRVVNQANRPIDAEHSERTKAGMAKSKASSKATKT